MDDDVRGECDGDLQVRAEKGVVDNQQGIAIAGNFGDGGDVSDAHGRISRRFDVEDAGIGAHGGENQIRRRGVYEAELEAEVDEKLGGEAVNATVDRFRKHNVIAGAEQTEHRIDGRHAGGKSVSGLAAFQFGERFFPSFAVGGIGTGVVEAFIFAEFVLDVGGGLVDGRYDSSSSWIRLWSYLDGSC